MFFSTLVATFFIGLTILACIEPCCRCWRIRGPLAGCGLSMVLGAVLLLSWIEILSFRQDWLLMTGLYVLLAGALIMIGGLISAVEGKATA